MLPEKPVYSLIPEICSFLVELFAFSYVILEFTPVVSVTLKFFDLICKRKTD